MWKQWKVFLKPVAPCPYRTSKSDILPLRYTSVTSGALELYNSLFCSGVLMKGTLCQEKELEQEGDRDRVQSRPSEAGSQAA